MSNLALPRVTGSKSPTSSNGHNGKLGFQADPQQAHVTPPFDSNAVNDLFLRMLPAVRIHAQVQFGRLRQHDHEEALAEATAAAFLIVHSACRNGRSHRLKPSTVATYAALHVKDGGHVGGPNESTCDALSFKARQRRGFAVQRLRWADLGRYDCIGDPAAPVWQRVLIADRRSPVPDQAAFRLDWSEFLAGQTDRTRTAISLLAEGYRRSEVAERLGVTRPAITQRMDRIRRDWEKFRNGEHHQVERVTKEPQNGKDMKQ